LKIVVLENKHFLLKVSDDCVAKSLIIKANGEECLKQGSEIPLFSLTQERPFNNEIKLVYPNKKTTFAANRIRREGNKLIVGFEIIKFEAIVKLTEKEDYITFTLKEFIIPEDAYGVDCLFITPPPVFEFRLLQLPVIERERFGSCLGVLWNDSAAVNILSTSPHAIVDSETRDGYRIMYADALRDIRLSGTGAALIATVPENLLDCIDRFEKDYDIPRGVASRRSGHLNSSIYWTNEINLSNVDEHIRYAKKGGFTKILMYFSAFFKSEKFSYLGDYDFNDNYPGGYDDVKELLAKIKKAGIMPGIHILHSHIGLKSRYVTPVADHRLNLTRHFTLSKPLEIDDDVIYVEENPAHSPLNPKFQVLKFDGELIFYDSYTTEYPYCFKGCKRGYHNTNITSHNQGTIGGILDISEFSAMSVYVDERTSLQDEVAQKLADVYNCGFEFVYFDGSEGTNPPFEFNIPFAQLKVYDKLENKPFFCEGAAKTHFGWHMLSGGNAFDIFPMNVFKEKIAEFPLSEAPKMADDFTRINFGWWTFNEDTQPDIYEYGTSKAAAWDCPATIQGNLSRFAKNPRVDDVLEVMNRWEDVRNKNWLSKEQKEMLKDPNQEYILLVNENGEYELAPYFQIKPKSNLVSAFWFELRGRNYIVCWHNKGNGKLCLPILASDVRYEDELGKNALPIEKAEEGIVIPLSGRSYFSADISKEEIVKAFENSFLV